MAYHMHGNGNEVEEAQWTREWWDEYRLDYEMVTSDAVLDELGRGNHPVKVDALALLDGLELLTIEPVVADIAEAYVVHQLMHKDPAGDALHLALASYHKCVFPTRGLKYGRKPQYHVLTHFMPSPSSQRVTVRTASRAPRVPSGSPKCWSPTYTPASAGHAFTSTS